MKITKKNVEKFFCGVNFDGLRCTIKGDPSIREMLGALKRQKEIDNQKQD